MIKTNPTNLIEVIENRLYWYSNPTVPQHLQKVIYFNIDDDLAYNPFNYDFGPLDIGKVHTYSMELQKLLLSPEHQNFKIMHYTSAQFDKIANSVFLVCAFLIIVKKYSVEQAFEPFKDVPIKPFRDAGYGAQCSYKCTIKDCLQGLDYAIKLKWYDYKKFNLQQYKHYELVENGDLNWIIPGKFVAFSSPNDTRVDKYGNRILTPQDYVPIFNKIGVKMVVRLNNITYKAQGFTKQKIKHHDLIFTDGTAPNMEIVNKFLQIAEGQEGGIAVHCKAGLGRTGSLIACYAMKHYRFPAADFIGWIRIVRPGSILGPQQHFLIEVQKTMFQKGKSSPIWKEISQYIDEKQTISRLQNLSIHKEQMNQRERQIKNKGQLYQGQNLVEAKMRKRERQQQKLNDSSTNPKNTNETYKQKVWEKLRGDKKNSSITSSSKDKTSPSNMKGINKK